jgi:hypothetical protein
MYVCACVCLDTCILRVHTHTHAYIHANTRHACIHTNTRTSIAYTHTTHTRMFPGHATGLPTMTQSNAARARPHAPLAATFPSLAMAQRTKTPHCVFHVGSSVIWGTT